MSPAACVRSRFKDGEEVPADLVIMAVGIRPDTQLAESAKLRCDRGILVNDTMQTYDPRIYAVGECVSHRGIAYGLVAPLFEQAKVCANHLAQYGFGRYTGSVTSTKLKVTGIDLFSAGDFTGGEGTEDIVLHDASGSVYKKLVIKDDKNSRQRDVRRHRRRLVVFPDAARGQEHRRHPRPFDVRPDHAWQFRPSGAVARGEHAGRDGSVRVQRRMQGGHRQGHQGERTVLARRCAQTHEGFRILRIVHRAGGADSRVDAGRCLRAAGEHPEADVRLHRPHPRGSAQGHPRGQTALDPRGHGVPKLEDAQRLRLVPPGAQLLPHLLVAARSERRSAVALHQRAGAREYPEGRDLLGHSAHVRRRYLRAAAAAHRGRGGQVQHPYGEGHRRPAHRPARRKEGRPPEGLGSISTCPPVTRTPRRFGRSRPAWAPNGAGSACRIPPTWVSSWSAHSIACGRRTR